VACSGLCIKLHNALHIRCVLNSKWFLSLPPWQYLCYWTSLLLGLEVKTDGNCRRLITPLGKSPSKSPGRLWRQGDEERAIAQNFGNLRGQWKRRPEVCQEVWLCEQTEEFWGFLCCEALLFFVALSKKAHYSPVVWSWNEVPLELSCAAVASRNI
jgi:hypothetical protein